MANIPYKTIGSYQIVSFIGRGGMGTVYKAIQPSLNRYVAIKVLPEYFAQDDEFVQRFQREATVIASLQHPNILTIYDVGRKGDLHYIVMQLLEGSTLAQIIEREGILPLSRISGIISQIASALDYAHQRNIIHRDIKPTNIFIGDGDHATLMDFGIVKALSETRLTRTGVVIGTPEYMSPEQVKGGAVDQRSDLYSLGVVLYQMLTGQVPFIANTPNSVLYAHVHMPPPKPSQLNPSIHPAIEAVVLKALEKDPQARYQSGAQMALAFREAVQQAETEMLERLYVNAKRLMDDWKLDESLAMWNQLRLLRPDYKDAAAQMDETRRRQETLLEYRELVQTARQIQARLDSFAQRNPKFPDIQKILTRPQPTALLGSPMSIAAVTIGIALLLAAWRLIATGLNQARQAWDLGTLSTPEMLYPSGLLATGNYNLGLGIGVSIAGGILCLGVLVLLAAGRQARPHANVGSG